MKTRFRVGVSLSVVLSVAGAVVVLGPKKFDHALAVLIGGLYIAGSVVLVLKGLVSRPEDRLRIFYHGELALLPASWRRWMLDEKEPPVHR
jgi:hypothetical protein